jgi:hypothetical protein
MSKNAYIYNRRINNMTDFKNLFDIRIYNYFLNHERLADMLNVVLFDGKMLVLPQDIMVFDSNSSEPLLSTGETFKRTRDHLFLVDMSGQQCFIGLEHQSYVDKSMFQRIMEYDYLSYLRQYHAYEKNIHQKINGVMTLAIYYGEKKWNCARSYRQMMNQGIRHLRRYMNVEFHPLVEMVKLDETRFHNKDNRDFVKGLKILYGKKKIPDTFIVSHEIACLLGTLIHDERIYQMIEKKKGATNMSDYVLGISRKAKRKGKNEGIITTLVKQLKQKLGELSKDTIKQIKQSNKKQLDCLTIHIFDIESEEDIIKILTNQ